MGTDDLICLEVLERFGPAGAVIARATARPGG